jgi:DeoR/GlpR family transcriptional regulator of sugar metabolism
VFPAERRRRILELVRETGAVSMRELAVAVCTSEVTVRRDVRALEAEGLIDRRHGGAMVPEQYEVAPRPPVVEMEGLGPIATLAARMVAPGDAIVLGAGQLVEELARRLSGMAELTVVTNSLRVAEILSRGRTEVVLTGGILRSPSLSLVGDAVDRSVAGLRVQRAFVCGDGLTGDRGLSSTNMLAASAHRALTEAATQVVVLAGGRTVGVDAMFQTVLPRRIAHLVSTAEADPSTLAALQAGGATVHLAESPALARTAG